MASKKQKSLRWIPLGGLGEIGKNMYVLEYGEDMLVIDCGSIFPQEDMPGIDLVIPDFQYVQKNKEKIRGILITHGHEDHIGAVPFVLREIKAPVFGTRLTLSLIEHKLKEHRIHSADLRCISPGDRIDLGCFGVEFIKMSHSIAGAVALALHTPLGTIVHTGDFKVDYTPVDGALMDFGKFAQLGGKGVLALMIDSTNSERPGFTMSERTVGESFGAFFQEAAGRVIVATFASNIHRVQQIVDISLRYGRKVCLAGRSMINIATLAMNIGELSIPSEALVQLEELDNYGHEELTIITTGSQGEPMSGLVRMATSEHRHLEIVPGDTVIISASPIPGNEKFVSRVINLLYLKGANVIYEKLADVHVSGHACQEELKLIWALTRPKYYIPVHGEARHLIHNARLAEKLGMPRENVFHLKIGDVLEFTRSGASVKGSVPSGAVLVDGSGVGELGSTVLRDRRLLSQEGMLVAVLAVNGEGALVGEPDLISRGFVYVAEADALMNEAKAVVVEYFAQHPEQMLDIASIKNNVRSALQNFMYQKTKRRPMILPFVAKV